MTDLLDKHCQPNRAGTAPLTRDEVCTLLETVPGWETNSAFNEITRSFSFKDFHHTMAFVNAVAWIANQEDHHPDLNLGYGQCQVRYSTHSIGGLSKNDFICAAKINTLLD